MTFADEKAERQAERDGYEHVLKHQQLRKFQREIRDIILTLVNDYGIEYRLQKDGQHLFLYNGRRNERPFKIAAQRPVDKQLGFLVPWLRESFPNIDVSSGKVMEVVHQPYCAYPDCGEFFGTTQEVDDHLREVHGIIACQHCGRLADQCDQDPCPTVRLEREALVVTDEKVAEIEKPLDKVWTPEERAEALTDGDEYEDTEGSFDTSSQIERALEDLPTEHDRMVDQEAREEVAGALDTLAGYLGHVVLTSEDWEAYSANRHALSEAETRASAVEAEVAVLRREKDALQEAFDSLKAKFDLAREAFGL